MAYQDLHASLLIILSAVFMILSVVFMYMEKYLQALLAFVIGTILLSSSLSIIRERIRYQNKSS